MISTISNEIYIILEVHDYIRTEIWHKKQIAYTVYDTGFSFGMSLYLRRPSAQKIQIICV